MPKLNVTNLAACGMVFILSAFINFAANAANLSSCDLLLSPQFQLANKNRAITLITDTKIPSSMTIGNFANTDGNIILFRIISQPYIKGYKTWNPAETANAGYSYSGSIFGVREEADALEAEIQEAQQIREKKGGRTFRVYEPYILIGYQNIFKDQIVAPLVDDEKQIEATTSMDCYEGAGYVVRVKKTDENVIMIIKAEKFFSLVDTLPSKVEFSAFLLKLNAIAER